MSGLNPPTIPPHQPIGDKGRIFIGFQPKVGIDYLGRSLGQGASFAMRGHCLRGGVLSEVKIKGAVYLIGNQTDGLSAETEAGNGAVLDHGAEMTIGDA